MFKDKNLQMIGLDIGSRYVKAVLIDSSKNGRVLKEFACEPVIGDAVTDGVIKDFEAVSKTLNRIKKSLKSKNKNVAIAVTGASVITKVVPMKPGLTDLELESQIEIEADSLIPYPLEEVYVDFEELGVAESDPEKVQVLLSAAHRDVVDSKVTLIREVEYNPLVVDVEGYALGNSLHHFASKESDQLVCCANIGADQLLLTVVKGEQIVYSKEHNFGVDNLIQDLSIIHTLDRDEAAKQLMNDTLPETWRQDTYPQFVTKLSDQLSRSIQLYVSSTSHEPPQSILISGGGSNIKGMAEELDREMGIEVKVFNPFEEMEVDEKVESQALANHAPQLAIAAGLASRSFNPCHI